MPAPTRARKLIYAAYFMEIGYNIGAIIYQAGAQARSTSGDS
jgi:hypothetical protein